MGGLTYLFAFTANLVLATIIAAIGAAIAAAVPLRQPVEPNRHGKVRAKRAAITFAVIWLGLILYGCVEMFRPHWRELEKSEAAGMGNGMLASPANVEQAVTVSHGDTAQSYALIRTTAADVERLAATTSLKRVDFDAHTAAARGWLVPDWWPKTACAGGVTYSADTSAPWSDTTVNWCPREGRAYLQRYDY